MAQVFDPGRMTARLMLEAPVEAGDGQGGAAVSWQAVCSLWALVEPMRVFEREEAAAEAAIVSHRIWVWFRQDIVAGQRFRKGTRVFSVKLVRDPDETRRFLLCHCEEGAR
ncbi:head-tail adaptor protein [Pseudorhizobium endolithicum]|uniref:Head-tail adaptor protein n=1 Tax=Pseudorhizobium endolithicum TaxID=1191678 RepID=A0ABN7JIT4_9HYPH|nr:phage head closure protein [Pseudorhizobium endolithicum]CAD6421048.1 head-tail adaptor protein [Rhizobium sp. Q54]CAD7027296.1 head-tail adaptor protein [Pseudorhizobium endolithicum]